jgi:hypothetical protein
MSTYQGQRPAVTALRALLAAGVLCAMLSAPASAAPANWLDPVDLSKPGRDALSPEIAMDSGGNALAVWERERPEGPGINLQYATRSAGELFGAPLDLQRLEGDAKLAMAPNGEAAVLWRALINPPGSHVVNVATRPPGGSFSPPVTILPKSPSSIPQEPRLAIGSGGAIVVTWAEFDPTSEFPNFSCGVSPFPPNEPTECDVPSHVMATVRPAGGVFTAPEQISPPTAPKPATPAEQEVWAKEESVKDASQARPAIDAAGNAVVVFTYFDGTESVIHSNVRQVGAEFGESVQISQSGGNAGGPDLDMDAAGTAIATWIRAEAPAQMIQAALRPPGGSFSVLGNLSPVGGAADSAAIDVSESGSATIVWRLDGFPETFLQAASRAPGGAFDNPVNMSSGKDNPLFPEVAVNDAGDAIVVWNGDNAANEIVRAAVRPAGAGFNAPVAISQASAGLFHPKPTLDAGGNAAVVWTRSNGFHSIVQTAGYDSDPPQLRDVSIPGAAVVGDTARFSATAADVWPVGPPAFDFGDGSQASGGAVSHAYSGPGSYAVRVTVTDAVGRSASATGPILVKARNFFTIGKLKKNRRKGTATLAVTIPEPGTLVVSGRGIRRATLRSDKGATLRVPLKGAGKGLKRLNRKGKLKSKLKLVYSPVGGDPNSQQRRIALSKKLP